MDFTHLIYTPGKLLVTVLCVKFVFKENFSFRRHVTILDLIHNIGFTIRFALKYFWGKM